MPRRKEQDTHLPPRLRLKHGAYYHVAVVDGSQSWQWLSRDYGEALLKWADLEAETIPRGRKVEDAITHFLATRGKELAPKTRRGYAHSAKQLIAVFGRMALLDLKPRHVYEYLQRCPKKYQANRDVALLSVVYKWANAWGWTEPEPGYNPCRKVPRHSEEPRRRYVTDAELEQLTAAASPQMRCMIVLSYLTGIRKSDMLGIRVANITDEGLLLRPSKTKGSTGRVQLFEWTDALRAVVREAQGLRRRVSSLFLFSTRHGQPFTESGFDSNWQRLRERAQLPDVRWQDVRRKAGSDVDLEHAFQLLGHVDRRTTKRHYRAAPERVKPVK